MDRIELGRLRGEPLRWTPLAAEAGRTLLLCEALLPPRPFHESRVPVSWRRRTLRAWLNGDFPAEAFTAAEKARLIPRAGDPVFCLSEEEVRRYAPHIPPVPEPWWTCTLSPAPLDYACAFAVFDGAPVRTDVHADAVAVRPAIMVAG